MKASERRLLTILVVLALVAGSAILCQFLLGKQRLIERREETLSLRQVEADAMLADKDLWHARQTWLQSAQPSMTSESQASNELLDTLVAAAAKNDLVVQKRALQEPVTRPFYREVGVSLTLKGQFPAMFRWLHEMLDPAEFRAISFLKIIPDEADKSAVVCTVHFSRFYAPATAATPPKEAPES
ncbi:hypothetical protein [Prosthecobacter sp.]|uniref:hypothetical protein n=1 Tax=Prosthecobacter sp. TaxID=1965333 RepID=UPI00378520BD